MEHQLSQQDIANWAMIIITVGALAIGLISMLVGQLMRAIDWWRDGVAQARSNDYVDATDRHPVDPVVAAPVAAPPREAGQLIAKPGNDGNAELPGNAGNLPLPAEARDIIRMQTRAEVVVALLKSAKMTNKAEAIELVFECSRSGRPGSTYHQALTLVDALIDRYPQRTPEQQAERQKLGLA